MDITKYFKSTDEKVLKKDKKYNLSNKLIELKNNKKITMAEYTDVILFMKEGGPIHKMRKINKILNDPKISACLKKVFEHYMVNKSDSEDLVEDILDGVTNKFSDNQESGLCNIIKFLYNDSSVFSLSGYAGTGKTTLISELINYLVTNNIVSSVAMTAPTNQAVDVMKSKMLSFNKDLSNRIDFITIHKLLQYENDFDVSNGGRVFVRNKKGIMDKYSFVIVDEASMISINIMKDLYSDIKQYIKNNPKVIFVGDPAQLYPVGEHDSPLYSTKKNKHELYIDSHYTLKQIVRNKNNDVNNLCNEVREWVLYDVSPNMGKYQGEYVHFYNYKKNVALENTKFIKRYMKPEYLNTSIILTWTNEKALMYNMIIRHKIFNNDKLNKFEIGDKLIFNDFYKVPNLSSDEGKMPVFYTSNTVRIKKIEVVTHKFNNISYDLPASKQKLPDGPSLEAKYRKTIENINHNTKKTYKLWKLTVEKFKKNSKSVIIYVVHDDSIKILSDEKNNSQYQIKKLWIYYKTYHSGGITNIIKYIIKPLWKSWSNIFQDPFANIDYGYARTCHKSQGATYINIFADLKDILRNTDHDDAKRCTYVAFTRASKQIHIQLP